MEKNPLYSFSKPCNYHFRVFGNKLPTNFNQVSWSIIDTESSLEGMIISAEQTVKDQAHLLGLIQELNANHFTIIAINKIDELFNLN